ncbi:hypothetical protein [Clostridium tyrobutyricum]|uniref:hypothetical protein n=1 Tax=Clostridium tyrobutyricum TaxID=1519 RepID=UPI00057F5DF8|nr:hypothetical protein [Clostridium tyrobutyricum]MBV4427183.1 phage tail assembly protein [Clostridium tyrobutyricum]MBV4440207.1 phage tail assembly protein [Clostridium tyrobutyricum]MBV4442482.1 phage tail assembly protein [Clostridium tyrobutyricum]
MSTLKLSKPAQIDGEEKTEIQYDFDELKGNSVENAIKELQKKGYVPAVQEVDTLLYANLFAQAANLDYEDIKRLNAKDFMKTASVTRDFFLAGSADFQDQNTLEQ